jgi:serine protease Do
MKKFKIYLFSLLILISFNTKSFSKGVPESFADLAEKLMPSVVNISTTQTCCNQY